MTVPVSAATSTTHAGGPRVRTGVLVAYAVPGFASSFVFTAVSLYLLKFSTDVLLMAPAVVGLIFGAARIWDGLTDPWVGFLSDRTRTRFGRRRPWMVASVLPVALTYYAVWAPPASLTGVGLTVWMTVAILAFYTAITAFAVPYIALGAELSRGHHERTRVFGAKAAGDQVGILAAAGALLVMEQAPSPRTTAVCMAALAALLMAGAIAWCVAVLREPREHQGRGGTSPFASFADVLRNRGARILLAVFFLEMLGYHAFVTLMPYVTAYVLETPGSTAYYLFTAISATLLSVPLWITLSRRFGKVRVWQVALVVKVGVFAGIACVGAGDWLLIGALSLAFGVTTGASVVLGPSVKADVVDSDEAATGERKEGTFFAAWNLAIKTALGIAIVLSGVVLSATGFRPNVAQSETALLGIRALASLLPAVCHLVAALLLRLPLDPGAEAVRARASLRRRAPGGIVMGTRLLSAVLVLSIFEGCGTASRVDFGRLVTSGRDGWQHPELVMQELALEPGDLVAEIGAGDGYWLPWLSQAVGDDGRVYAVEVDDAKVGALETFVAAEGLRNVEVIRGTFDDPQLPDGAVDVAMTCLTYHHIDERPAYFARLRTDLAADGRVVHLDDRPDAPAPFRWFQSEGHWSEPEAMEREMAEAGYRRVASYDFLPTQSFQVFAPGGEGATR